MEINITRFFNDCAPRDYSASMAELGPDAGRITWSHSVEDSPEYFLLDDEDKREAFRSFVKSSGGWSETEIRAWSDIELNALFIQWIAGDMRELGIDNPINVDWGEVERVQSEGLAPSNIFKGIDGEIYFYAEA